MVSLPLDVYAAIAPLPAPLGDHFYQYWCALSPKASFASIQAHVLREIAEKRSDVYLVMDGFVRNRDNSNSPHHLRFSTQWVREQMLAPYTPNQTPVPPKTFNQWLASGFIRSERKGHPTPDSVAAVGILRMGIKGKKALPGASLSPDEPPWWCYVQEAPDHEAQCVPVTQLAILPAHALIWTPWAGAAWDARWMLIGNGAGAIRFVGVQTVEGQVHYTLSRRDLFMWRPHLSTVFSHGSFARDEHQAVTRLALVQLAQERLSPFGYEGGR